jgi:type II secretion system protein N
MEKSQRRSSLIVEDMPVLRPEDESEEVSSVIGRKTSVFSQDAWGESASPRVKKGRRFKKILTYSLVGFTSFFLFLYLSFPFNVVKEVLIGKVNDTFMQNSIRLRLTVGNFKLKLPLGLSFEDIQLTNVNDPSAVLKLGKATVSLSSLSLFVGKLSTHIRVEQSGGNFELETSHSISDLIALGNSRRAVSIPKGTIDLDFARFELRPLVSNFMIYFRTSNDPSLQTILPFLSTEIGGQLNGKIKVDMSSTTDSLEKLNADVDLKIQKAYLELKNETLPIPRQDFTDARIKLKLLKKSLDILPETKFAANDVGVNLSGRLSISDLMDVTDMKLNLGLALRGKLEENFKTLIPVGLRCDPAKFVDGKMDVEISGNLLAHTCT